MKRLLVAIAFTFSLQLGSGSTFPVASNTKQIIPENPSQAKWQNAELVNTLAAHQQQINLLRFSPDGRLLASVEPGAIAVWQVKTGTLQRILPGHSAKEANISLAPTDIAFSPDSKLLASATWSQGSIAPKKEIIVWEVATGKEVAHLQSNGGCRDISFGNEGDILYGACGKGVQVWQLTTGKKLFSFAPQDAVEAIAISHNGKLMATASDSRDSTNTDRVRLWRLDKAKATPIETDFQHNNAIAQLEFTSDDRKLVSSSYDGKIKVWNWQTSSNLPLVSLNSQSHSFSLNANSNLIASNFANSAIANLVTGLPLETAVSLPQQGLASAIAFSPQEPVLAWAGQPPTYPNPVIFLWQAEETNSLSRSPLAVARDEYVTLNLEDFWGEKATRREAASLVGKDPEAITLAALGLREVSAAASEAIEIASPQNNLAVVTLTQTNLADDSVFGVRYRLEFAPYGAVEQNLWRVIWAGEQYRCQIGRGIQSWSKNLCQ